MIVTRGEAWTGRILLILLMAFTVVPFISLFVTALHPSGTYPSGIAWPSQPQWGNFGKAFSAANMGALLKSSVLIVLGVVPLSLLMGTMAGFAFGHLKVPGHRIGFLLFVLGLTLPFEGIITPLYYQMRDLGLLNTRWAIILPLLGLFMPFSVLWMLGSFRHHARRPLRGRAHRRRQYLAAVLARPRTAGPTGTVGAGHPAVPVDVEPVPVGHRVGR